MTDNWYSRTVRQIEEKLNTDIGSGLSMKAAKTRRRLNGENMIYREKQESFFKKIKHIFTDYINILFIIVVIIASLLEKNPKYLFLLLIMLVSNVIVMLVYAKACSVLDGMGHLSLPFAKVIREGKLFVVKQENLVRGDIIILSQGDIVPCDARLIESDKLFVLESNLLDVKSISAKDAKFHGSNNLSYEEQKNMLFASTVVTRGSGKAIVCDIGKDTLVCCLNKNKVLENNDKLSVLDTFKRYCRNLSLCLTALIFVLTFIDLVLSSRGIGLFPTFLTGLSLAVSSMSEQFVIFGYIIVGCGIFSAIHKSKNLNSGALIKNSSKLEKLKDVSTLIIHKEGILSLKKIKVEKVFANNVIYSIGDRKFLNNCKRIIRYAVISSGRYGSKVVSGNIGADSSFSKDDDAIIEIADTNGLYNISLDREYPIVDHVHNSEDNIFDTTLTVRDGKYIVTVKGECTKLLERCSYYRCNNIVVPMTSEIYDEILLSVLSLKDEAYRIIGVASKNFNFNSLDRIRSAQNELVFEGFLAIREPILPNVAKEIRKCRKAGMKILVLADDLNSNNLSFANLVGITDNDSCVLTGSMLYRMGEKDFAKRIDEFKLFENFTTSQKRLLIKILKDRGETVAVVGTKLAEIVLEKDADIGIAQSMIVSNKDGKIGVDLSGRDDYSSSAEKNCEALKFVSDVIISDAAADGSGGFNAIVGVVESSKVIYQNILRTVRYLMISQFAKFFTVLYAVLTGNKCFTPSQILLCGLLIDLAAIIIIAFEKPSFDELSVKVNTEDILKKPFIKYWHMILIALIWTVLTVFVPYVFAYFGLPISSTEYGTYVFFSFIMSQIVTLNEAMKEKSLFVMNIRLNRVYVFVFSLIVAFLFLCVNIPVLSELFGTVKMSLQAWLCTLSVPLLLLFVHEIYKLLYAHILKRKVYDEQTKS